MAAGFSDLLKNRHLLSNIRDQNFRQPTEIQSLVIPSIKEDLNLLGLGRTGTGKTLSYVLPVLDREAGSSNLTRSRRRGRLKKRGTTSLILTPTPELTHQVNSEIQIFGGSLGIKSVSVSTADYDEDRQRLLKERPSIVVANLEAALSIEERGDVNLREIRSIIIDEADVFLGRENYSDLMGFLNAFPEIDDTQRILMGATLPNSMLGEVASIIPGGKVYNANYETPLEKVKHLVYEVERHKKASLCVKLLKYAGSTIIFCRDQKIVEILNSFLHDNNINASFITEETSAEDRIGRLDSFRKGEQQVLIVCGLNERGIDVSHLTHIINYDLPESLDSCVHRVGRVGRAGRSGTSIYLVDPRDRWNSSLMFRLLNIKPEMRVPRYKLKTAKKDLFDQIDSLVLGVQKRLGYKFKNISLLATALKRNRNFHDPSESLMMLGFVGRMALKLAAIDFIAVNDWKTQERDFLSIVKSCRVKDKIKNAAEALELKGFLHERDVSSSFYGIEEATFYNCIGAMFLDSHSIDTIQPLFESVSSFLDLPSEWSYDRKEIAPKNYYSRLTPELKGKLEEILDHKFKEKSWLEAIISYELNRDGKPMISPEIITRGFAVFDLVLTNLLRQGFFDLSLREIFEKQKEYSNFTDYWNTEIGAQISRELQAVYVDDYNDESFKTIIIALVGALYLDGGYEKTEAFVRRLMPVSEEWLKDSEDKKRGSINIPELEVLLKSEGERLKRRREARKQNERKQAKARSKTVVKKKKKTPEQWVEEDHKIILDTELTVNGKGKPKYKHVREDGIVTANLFIGKELISSASHKNQIFAEQLAAKQAIKKLGY